MTATSHIRGHEVYFNTKEQRWKYTDTDEVADYDRPCKRCGKLPTTQGYDACMGHIKGAKNACCGHGIKEGYIQF